MSSAEATPTRFGPFVLLRELGAGGMGSAHLALHIESGGLLVVKRLHPTMLSDPTVFRRFVHEAEVATHVRHPNVAALVAMGTVEEEPFLATEHVFGVALSTLVDRIEHLSTPPAPLGPALAASIEIALGVVAIHEAVHRETGAPLGLLHRDIGARNVLLGYDGRARIIDLGLGKSILSDWQTSHELLAGSPDYMAPEQAMGIAVDARADVFALSVTVWELLAGRKRVREATVSKRLERCLSSPPETLRNLRPEVSPELERVLMAGMALEPSSRLAAARLLVEGLEKELKRVAPGTGTPEVEAWLGAACATSRAAERRRLDQDLERVRELRGEDEMKTSIHLLAGGWQRESEAAPPVAPAPPPRAGVGSALLGAKLELPARSTDALVPRLEVSFEVWRRWGLGVLFVAVALVTALLTSGTEPAPVIVEQVPLTSSPPPKPTPAAPLPAPTASPVPVAVEPVPPEPVPEAPPLVRPTEAPAPLPAARPLDETERRALVARLRALRGKGFDIRFQKELTRLSARLSRARNSRDLARVERRLRALEARR